MTFGDWAVKMISIPPPASYRARCEALLRKGRIESTAFFCEQHILHPKLEIRKPVIVPVSAFQEFQLEGKRLRTEPENLFSPVLSIQDQGSRKCVTDSRSFRYFNGVAGQQFIVVVVSPNCRRPVVYTGGAGAGSEQWQRVAAGSSLAVFDIIVGQLPAGVQSFIVFIITEGNDGVAAWGNDP